jgi:hypothetical protein
VVVLKPIGEECITHDGVAKKGAHSIIPGVACTIDAVGSAGYANERLVQVAPTACGDGTRERDIKPWEPMGQHRGNLARRKLVDPQRLPLGDGLQHIVAASRNQYDVAAIDKRRRGRMHEDIGIVDDHGSWQNSIRVVRKRPLAKIQFALEPRERPADHTSIQKHGRSTQLPHVVYYCARLPAATWPDDQERPIAT